MTLPPRPALLPLTLMSCAAFTMGAGMRVLDPLLPMVAESFGVTVAGAAGVVAGFLLPYGLGQIGIGPLGDRFGKLRVATIATLCFGVAMAASGFAGTLGGLIALRALAGLCAGAVIPVMMAHLGDTVPYQDRQAVMGRFSTGMVMAQLLTGPLAGVIGGYAGWRATFALLGVLALAAGLALAWRIGPVLWQPNAPPLAGQGMLSGYLRLAKRPAGQWIIAVGFADGFLLFGGAFPYVGSFLVEDFHLTAAMTGVVVAGFGLGAFIYTRMARRLVKRFGERGLLLRGGLGLAVGLLVLALSPAWGVVLAAQVWLGLAFYMFHGVLQARATEALPEARGTAVATFAMALFLGQSAGSLVFGLGLGWLGYRGGFLVAALGVAVLAFWSRREKPGMTATSRGFG